MAVSSRENEPKGAESDSDSVRTLSSGTLLGGRRELVILHGNERYRLLLTRSNKLILTK
jgi:hemin uptake protein HemP